MEMHNTALCITETKTFKIWELYAQESFFLKKKFRFFLNIIPQ